MNEIPSTNAAKVQLSLAEMALVAEPGWILTKNSIMGKAVELLAEVSEGYKLQATSLKLAFEKAAFESYKLQAASDKPAAEKLGEGNKGKEDREDVDKSDLQFETCRLELDRGLTGAKISKGENYKGLPYVILDYPRVFGKEDVFAIRTMMWWGHYFSVTLHLKGCYKKLFLPVIRERIGLLTEHGFHISESEDEWRHELDRGNYRPLEMVNEIEELLTERPFLKLSAKCGLDKWNEAGSILQELFRALVQALGG